MEFGFMLKQMRLDKKLSQRELSAKTSISHSYICQIETGQRILNSIDMIERYANGLDVPVLDLIISYLEFKETA